MGFELCLGGACQCVQSGVHGDYFRLLYYAHVLVLNVLCIYVCAGYIGKLKLQIPVRYIKSQPWVIQIDQLYVVAGPAQPTPVRMERERRGRKGERERERERELTPYLYRSHSLIQRRRRD